MTAEEIAQLLNANKIILSNDAAYQRFREQAEKSGVLEEIDGFVEQMQTMVDKADDKQNTAFERIKGRLGFKYVSEFEIITNCKNDIEANLEFFQKLFSPMKRIDTLRASLAVSSKVGAGAEEKVEAPPRRPRFGGSTAWAATAGAVASAGGKLATNSATVPMDWESTNLSL